MDGLEKALASIFVKSAPALPAKAKKALVEWLPWINLVLGILTLLSVYWLWHWAHLANSLINYANQLSQALGVNTVAVHRLTAGIWLALIVLALEAVLYLAAFSPLKARRKAGWNLLFYAALVNILYGLVLLFTDYGGVGRFLSSLIGSAIGFYFLFQIREAYSGGRSASQPTAPTA